MATGEGMELNLGGIWIASDCSWLWEGEESRWVYFTYRIKSQSNYIWPFTTKGERREWERVGERTLRRGMESNLTVHDHGRRKRVGGRALRSVYNSGRGKRVSGAIEWMESINQSEGRGVGGVRSTSRRVGKHFARPSRKRSKHFDVSGTSS
jgi:hypothetical protein